MEVDVRRFLFACLGEDLPSNIGATWTAAPLAATEAQDPGFLLPLKRTDPRSYTSDDVYSIPVHGIEFYPSQAAARKKLGQLHPSEYPVIPPELAYGRPATERTRCSPRGFVLPLCVSLLASPKSFCAVALDPARCDAAPDPVRCDDVVDKRR